MEEEATPPPPEETPPGPEQVTPVRRPIRKRNEAGGDQPDGEGDAALAGAIALLTRLYTQHQGKDSLFPSEEGGPATTAERLRTKRLPRTGGTGEGSGGTAEPPAPRGDGEESAPAAPQMLRPMIPRGTRPPRRKNWVPTLAWLGGLVLLLVGAWVLYRSAQKPPAIASQAAGQRLPAVDPAHPIGEIKVSDEASKVADQAVEAMNKGQWDAALTLLNDARKRQLQVPGLLYQTGLLALHQGQQDEAETALEASIDAHELEAESCYLRASIAGGQANYTAAAEQFAAAVRAEPFNPRSYFYLGECLRRQGKPAQAVTQFEAALKRRPNSLDAELILLKLNLAKLEAGGDAELQAALKERLAQEPVSPNALFLAAANEITRGDAAAATPFLRKAAESLPTVVYRSRLHDFMFHSPTLGQELPAQWAEFGPVQAGPAPTTPSAAPAAKPTIAPRLAESPNAGAPLIDPATRNLMETDPANW